MLGYNNRPQGARENRPTRRSDKVAAARRFEKGRSFPRYLNFAAHYGFDPRACNVRRPNDRIFISAFLRQRLLPIPWV